MKKKLRYLHLPTKTEIQKRIKKERERKALRKLFENFCDKNLK